MVPPKQQKRRPGVASGAAAVMAATTGTVPQPRAAPGTTAARFLEYHERNPGVYAALARIARELRRERPGQKISIAEVHEIARWRERVRTGEAPQLSNSYRPYYARLLMLRERDLDGVFELRSSAADELVMDPPDDGRLF